MRIEEHPILKFDRGKKITFYYNGEKIEGYENETVAEALHAAGIRRLGYSPELHQMCIRDRFGCHSCEQSVCSLLRLF